MKTLSAQFPIGGDVHYFRVPREDWRKRLELLREAGASYVSTYIPWMLHEPEEGIFRFSDSPKNDLEGFLTVCREMGLDVIAKPGPYQYSELRYCGLPAWLCEGYPEIMAQKKDGTAYNSFAVSYLHPVYLEKARRWYDAVLPILARHMKSRGGAVCMLQVDNELCFHEWFGGWDYHREVMGWGREDGPWAEYRRSHPGAEYHDFYYHCAAEYAATLARWIREAGIGCRLIHNVGNPNMISNLRELAQDTDIFLGVDMYYNLGMDFEANNPTPKFAANAFLGFEELRLLGFSPTVLEMQAGNCADWPPVTPENLTCWHNTCLAMGMKGVNWYVFTGGPNPPGLGGDGDLYDYCAAVSPEGVVRPAYGALQSFASFVKARPWLTEAEAACDYWIGLDWAHPRGRNDAGGEFGNPEVWSFVRKGIVTTGFCASRTPRLIDLAEGIGGTDKPLVVCTVRKMARRIQENLIGFLQAGGRLLLAPLLPELDETGAPCTLLKDFLGAGDCVPLRGNVDFCCEELTNIAAQTAFGCAVPEGGALLARDKCSGRTAGWEVILPGGGRAVWMGIAWKHAKHIHTALFTKLLNRLGAGEPAVHCGNPNVWAVLRTDGRQACLFVMNLFASPMEADIMVRGGESIRFSLAPMETRVMEYRMT